MTNSNLAEKNLKQKRRMCFPSLVLKQSFAINSEGAELVPFLAFNNEFSAMGTPSKEINTCYDEPG